MRARRFGAFAISVALHGALALWLAGAAALPSTRHSARGVEVVLLAPAEDSQFPGVQPLDRTTGRWKLDEIAQDDRLAEADLSRIVRHAPVLFPFVTPGLAVETFFPADASPGRLVFENPYAHRRPTAVPTATGPLDLSDAALRAIVDQSWSRGRRWQSFQTILGYVESHAPDDERLATLVRLYCERNALQPYADGAIRDLRLWAQLGLAADHVLFIGCIRQYVIAHPRTKVATELLLLLDTIAQANEDALAVLIETDQPDDLAWTRMANARAYVLLRRITDEYARELRERRLMSREAVAAYYDRTRLAILNGILKTTPGGYRANDARFLIGEIHWRHDRRANALTAWRQLADPGDDTFREAIAQMRAAVRAPDPDDRNIDLILRNQQGRWLAFSDDRLRRFGYRFDRY